MTVHIHYSLYAHITWHTWERRGCLKLKWLPDFVEAMRDAADRASLHVLRFAVLTDHVHILASFRPETRISEFVRLVKAISARRINQQSDGALKWARGFHASSVGEPDVSAVGRYIARQDERHPFSVLK